MSFTRTTVVDASPTGDSVKQAVLDLDADLTLGFTHLNSLSTSLALKIDTSQKGAASGVAELDSVTLVKRSQLVGRAYDIGDFKPWPSEDLPSSGDWLECDGAELDRTTYADLFAVIAYDWGGSGDTFNIPDFRGEFLRGWDHGRGLDGDADSRIDANGDVVGDSVASRQTDAIKYHPHRFSLNKFAFTTGNNTFLGQGNYDGGVDYMGGDDGQTYLSDSDTHPHNSAVMFIIRWR